MDWNMKQAGGHDEGDRAQIHAVAVSWITVPLSYQASDAEKTNGPMTNVGRKAQYSSLLEYNRME